MSENTKEYLAIGFCVLVAIACLLSLLSLTGCSNAQTGICHIKLVRGDTNFYSFVNGAQEHNNSQVVVEIDPGLVAKELPKINLSGAASVGWNSVRIDEIDGRLQVLRFGDGMQVSDIARVLDAMPLAIEVQQ